MPTGKQLHLHIFTFLLLFAAKAVFGQTQELPYPTELRHVGGPGSIAFISDTQTPLWVETLWLRSDRNDEATTTLLEKIARDSTSRAVFHLGDFTAMGSVEESWTDFDVKARPITEAGIPLYPAFGNHEYMLRPDAGKENILRRFPSLSQSWYVKRIDNIAIIILNSNFSQLSEQEVQEQQKWYERTLCELEEDTTVTFVIVGCHHSPYTNSVVVSPSEEVQRRFVRPFHTSTKARLFLSGHTHAFEHFQRKSKNFLVIGGGGGLLQPLLLADQQRWKDKFQQSDECSFFHYLRVVPHADELVAEVYRLHTGNMTIELAYQFTIPR